MVAYFTLADKILDMKLKVSKSITKHQINQISLLWNEVYPLKLIDRFGQLMIDTEIIEHHILVSEDQDMIGWAATFLRDDEVWFSIMISPANQNKGYGKMLLGSLKSNFKQLSGWVIDHNNDYKKDGSIYCTPIQFYLKNDFHLSPERLESDIISAAKITFG